MLAQVRQVGSSTIVRIVKQVAKQVAEQVLEQVQFVKRFAGVNMLVTVDYTYISVIESCSSRCQRGFRLTQSLSSMLYLPVTTLALQSY